MRRPRQETGLDAVVSAKNDRDGRPYRASIVWGRQMIAVEEASLTPGQTEIVQHAIFAEAYVWRKGWLNLVFRPTIVLSWHPHEPTDPRPASFQELTKRIITQCDLDQAASGEIDAGLQDVCAPYGVAPIFGYRLHVLTFRRVPHLLLFEQSHRARA